MIINYLEKLKNIGYNPNNILDIGANIGEFSSLCKKLWNTDILMLEGNNNCENDLRNTGIDYKICLLGDSKKEVDFYINRNNPKCTGSSYYKELSSAYLDCIIEKKQLNKLDDVVDKYFDLIKIDTQGSELDIIKGGKNTISNSEIVIIETSVLQYNIDSPVCDSIIESMKQLGFDKYKVIEQHHWYNRIDTLFKYGEVFQEDLVFYKNDKFDI